MKAKTMEDLFELGLRHAYDIEQKLVKKGLPSMTKASASNELQSAFSEHLEETRDHVTRLEQVFSIIGKKADKEDSDVFDEMSDEAEEVISDIDASPLRDAALIVSGNQVEHFEMAIYGSLVSFAQQLGYNEAVPLLQQTLKEEKEADAKLTKIAETSVNRSAILKAA